jgi:thiamine-monophosphate kinase
MAINLSDLAAMGARPEFFLLSIAFPAAKGEAFPLAVARGALSLASMWETALAGGDLSDSPTVVVSIALWGRPEREPIRRAGAKAGDLLYLSGSTGNAAAGLRLARSGAPPHADLTPPDRDFLLAAYRDPQPRVELGLALAREYGASAAIDVSDGLGIDAGRLARASSVRAVLEAERLPVSAPLSAFSRAESLDPIDLALSGGDDYELLFTVPPGRAAAVPPAGPGGVPLSRVGRIESGEGAVLRAASGDRDVSGLGHDHLRKGT